MLITTNHASLSAWHHSLRRTRNDRAYVLNKVGDAPTRDIENSVRKYKVGQTLLQKMWPSLNYSLMLDAVKLEREENEELEQGLQTPAKKEDPLVKSYRHNIKGKARPSAKVSDEVFDNAIKGVEGKKEGSIELVMKNLVDAKSGSDTRVQDEDVLKYASDLEDEAANGPRPTIMATRRNVAKE